jgi:hypothetical protein
VSLEDIVRAWAGGEPSAEERQRWSRRREAALPRLIALIDGFAAGELGLAEFVTALDRFTKRASLWGFRGRSGQMFLNTLMRAADHSRLEEELRRAISVPADETDAKTRIDQFLAFVDETRARADRLKRHRPKLGYVPYFLSFFWEARERDWPIYYPRSRLALARYGLFREIGPLAHRYLAYRLEILRLRDLLGTTTWGVEVLLYGLTAQEERIDSRRPTDRAVALVERPPDELEEEFIFAETDPQLVEERVDLLVDEIADAHDRIAATRAEQVGMRRDLHAYFEAVSLGMDTNLTPLPRFIEITLHLDRWDNAVETEAAALGFADVLGFVVADEFPPVRNSWFRRFVARTREVADRPEVQSRLAEGERALQVRAVDLPQAEVDARQAHAAAELISVLENQPKAAIQIGSILLLKTESGLAVRTLGPGEMLKLARNPGLLGSPESLLEALAATDDRSGEEPSLGTASPP